jgi:hypothetical protein
VTSPLTAPTSGIVVEVTGCAIFLQDIVLILSP